MVNAKCPRCREETLESLKTHDYCSSCNFSSELASESDMMIPLWAMKYLGELTAEDREEIREINLGMYTPGYELVVKRDTGPTKISDIKKVSQQHPRVPRRMQVRLQRRGRAGLTEQERKLISYFERMGCTPVPEYAEAAN